MERITGMKTTIFYFSSTGNSLHAAKTLAEALGECQLVSMAGLRHEQAVIVDADRVGFIFPMHYFGLPALVREFLGKITATQARYLFAVVTSGSGRFFSSALRQANSLLAKNGKQLAAGFHVGMISSYIPLSDIPPAAKVHNKLTKADEKLQLISNAIRLERRSYDAEPLWMPFAAINQYWRRKLLPHVHHKFSCAPSCTSCGICRQVCPVDNIRLVNGKPQWADHCQECLACLHFCPAESINFGARTQGRSRYHHPGVALSELIQPPEIPGSD